MFKITDGKGFHVTFENGWTVSVQFGWGNYCENRDFRMEDLSRAGVECGKKGSNTAECAVWGGDGNMVVYGDWSDSVGGWMTPKQVLELLTWAEAQNKVEVKDEGVQ